MADDTSQLGINKSINEIEGTASGSNGSTIDKYGNTWTPKTNGQYTLSAIGGFANNPYKSAPAATPTPKSAPTVGDIYNGVYTPDKNAADLATTEKASEGQYGSGTPNQGDSYTKALNDYQSEIDAINTLYTQKRGDVTRQYQDIEKNRLGSEGALLANSGMGGTSYGTSKTAEINKANADELGGAQSKVDADKQAAIASIMSNVRQQANSDYQTKLDSYTKGADAHLQYLKDSSTRKDSSVNNTVRNLIAAGIDITDPNANVNGVPISKFLDQITGDMNSAGVYGNTTSQDIITAYKAAKAIATQSAAKNKQDNEKAAADLAKTIAETAKTKADTSKIYSDIANGGTYQSGGFKMGKADLSTIQGILTNGNEQKGLGGKGTDGYANTNTYITLYNTWTSQGGLAKDFVAMFPPKTFLNPKDPSLPDQLKQAINTTSVNITIPGVQ